MHVRRFTPGKVRGVAPAATAFLLTLIAASNGPAAAPQSDDATDATAFVGSWSALAESWAADVASTSSAQAALPPEARPAPPPRRGWRFEVAGFSDAVTLDSVAGYDDSYYYGGDHKLFSWNDVDRVRYGGRFLAGNDGFRFGGEIFTERFEATNRFSGTGGDLVILGTPTLARGTDWSWILDSGMRLGYVRDHGDVEMADRFGNVISGHATLDYEFVQLDLGTGLRWRDFEIAAGMRLDDMLGYLDLDNGGWFYVDGTNLAFYARAGYQPTALPIVASATLFVGDVHGVMFVLGARF